MHSLMTLPVVRAIYDERVRTAAAAAKRRREPAPSEELVIRRANRYDARRLERLAQLDSAAAPAGPALVAELGGRMVAAMPLDGGRPVADPFYPSAPFVQMLELRRNQIRTNWA